MSQGFRCAFSWASPPVIEEETPTSTVYYIREADGSLIARMEGTAVHYYHFDDLGSTKLLTSAAGVVTDTYAYDAWGNGSHDTGTTNQPYQYVGELGYYTHWQDVNLDLLQLGVRFYDSEIGRFGQRDALPETLNAYEYVASRPLGLVDPDGLSSKKANPREREADIDEIGLVSTACAYLVRLRAIRDVQAQFPGKDLWDNSYRNAVMHCYWIALIALCCGRDAAVTVTNNHEKYNWDPRTGPMDLGNNKNGLVCFDNLKPCTGGVMTSGDRRSKLMKCCKDAKPVYIPGKPVPEYPGGNK